MFATRSQIPVAAAYRLETLDVTPLADVVDVVDVGETVDVVDATEGAKASWTAVPWPRNAREIRALRPPLLPTSPLPPAPPSQDAAPVRVRGIGVAAGFGAFLGFALPCVVGIAYLVPEPTFINPSGEALFVYATPLLLAGLTVGPGIGLVLGQLLGKTCCRGGR